ncbi:alkaline phosphatase D family protein [Parapedobacter tibetensis]|uniref:alkaline phosphatase D family protein n=1 Tax=Parapedobacter tibetensis TaxID=2972951 RepID=UPI00214D4BC0|nr:alkaline phosphatase D family protein [Parapedobacter tibetensis]
MRRFLLLTRKQFLASLLALIGQALLSKIGVKAKSATVFKHGVASGDPLQDSVIIWTRITTDNIPDTTVQWEIATDERFQQVVQRGTYNTSPERDYTVKVDVTGLQSGTQYYYRFQYQGEASSIGATKTLPTSLNGGAFHIAVVACNNWEAGYFSAFRTLAEKDEVDMVLHLGDYIYEYEAGRYSNDLADRTHEPGHEIVTLDDYRRRYAQYHTDPDLQLLHASKPFCLVWDDHEIANDSYADGAQNHQPETEGHWEARKQAGIQAYFEWLPVRGDSPKDLIRKLTIGKELELFLLDQRMSARTEQLTAKAPNFYDDARGILGAEQYNWLENGLRNSQARWKLIGNQVPITGYKPDAESLPSYKDKWLGYPHERNKLIGFLEKEKIENTIFLTGDHHKSFVLALHREKEHMQYTKAYTEKPLAWELLTPSVTSKNEDYRPANEVKTMEETLYRKEINPHLLFADIKSHGYYIARVDEHSFTADYYFIDDLYSRTVNEQKAASFAMTAKDFMLKSTKG